jgi:hypothetical protein
MEQQKVSINTPRVVGTISAKRLMTYRFMGNRARQADTRHPGRASNNWEGRIRHSEPACKVFRFAPQNRAHRTVHLRMSCRSKPCFTYRSQFAKLVISHRKRGIHRMDAEPTSSSPESQFMALLENRPHPVADALTCCAQASPMSPRKKSTNGLRC